MKLTLLVQHQALQDIEDIATFIEPDSEEATERFLSVTRSAMERLTEFPFLGSRRSARNPRLANLRQWVISEFGPYVILYIPTGRNP